MLFLGESGGRRARHHWRYHLCTDRGAVAMRHGHLVSSGKIDTTGKPMPSERNTLAVPGTRGGIRSDTVNNLFTIHHGDYTDLKSPFTFPASLIPRQDADALRSSYCCPHSHSPTISCF